MPPAGSPSSTRRLLDLHPEQLAVAPAQLPLAAPAAVLAQLRAPRCGQQAFEVAAVGEQLGERRAPPARRRG